MNILFTSGGRRVSLIRSFRHSLDTSVGGGRIVVADTKTDAPARFVADHFEQVPPVGHVEYVDTLVEICSRHAIRLLVPLIDPELTLLSRCRDRFRSVGTLLLASSAEVNEIAASKTRTADFLRKNGFRVPTLYSADEALVKALPYPVIIKPDDGSSSVGLHHVSDRHELVFFLGRVPHPVVQELATGTEVTCDVLVDSTGKVRCVVPRVRIETRAGEVSKGRTARIPLVMDEVQAAVERLPGAFGCLTVQCFVPFSDDPDQRPWFIEINPRFGGGAPLSIRAGADFPRWILQWCLGEEPVITNGLWQSDLTMVRFDEGIFIPPGLPS